MHSKAMPSLSASLTIFFFIASLTPCCPFVLPLKQTQYPNATSSGVPSLLVSCSPNTPQPFATQGHSGVSKSPIPLTPLTAAMRTLRMPDVSLSSREFALATWFFKRMAFLSARFPRRLFRANALRLLSVPGIFYPGSCLCFSDVLGAALPTHIGVSIADTFAYSCVPFEHPYSLCFGSHVLCGGGIPTLLPQAQLPRETISLCWMASSPVNPVGRLELPASTSSRISRRHEGTSIYARNLWPARRVIVFVTYS